MHQAVRLGRSTSVRSLAAAPSRLGARYLCSAPVLDGLVDTRSEAFQKNKAVALRLEPSTASHATLACDDAAA